MKSAFMLVPTGEFREVEQDEFYMNDIDSTVFDQWTETWKSHAKYWILKSVPIEVPCTSEAMYYNFDKSAWLRRVELEQRFIWGDGITETTKGFTKTEMIKMGYKNMHIIRRVD